MNERLRLRRILGTIQVSLKSVLIATLILCIVFPTATVLSLTRTSSAKASLPSHDSHHGYHKHDQGVGAGIHELEDMLGTQAKMMIELVPRDTEATNNYPLSKGKHGRGFVKKRQGAQFSKPTALADDSMAVISKINPRDATRLRGPPRPTSRPQKIHPRRAVINSDISDEQLNSGPRNYRLAQPEISTRAAQASGGGWGRQKPKPKKKPPPGIMIEKNVIQTPDILPRKIPCHRCSSFGPVDSDVTAGELEPRQYRGRPFSKPHNKPFEHKPINKRDDTIMKKSYSRHNKPSCACGLPSRHCQPIKRDSDVDAVDSQQDINATDVADVMRYLELHSGETNGENSTLVGGEAGPNNATHIGNGTIANNGTKNGTEEDIGWGNEKTAGFTLMYVVLVVIGFCMFLLFIILIRHVCIQRRRRNIIASRRKDYPFPPGASQQMDGSQADFITRKKTQGSNRMKRIDEEVTEEDQVAQPATLDGAGDGWTKWLLQKRETRKPAQMSPIGKNRSYHISTLKLPQPTFGTVRKANGMPSEASVGVDDCRGKGRGFSKAKWTSTI